MAVYLRTGLSLPDRPAQTATPCRGLIIALAGQGNAGASVRESGWVLVRRKRPVVDDNGKGTNASPAPPSCRPSDSGLSKNVQGRLPHPSPAAEKRWDRRKPLFSKDKSGFCRIACGLASSLHY